MFTRIRPLVIRPWIKRPRGIAIIVAALAILTNSSAFAQRGGGGCAGMSGGGGSPGAVGAGGIGIAGGTGGMGGGFGNPAMMQMQMAQMQRTQQGFMNVPPMQGGDDYGGDYRAQLAARKAYLAAQAEQRKKRLAARQEKQAKHVASRSRSTTSQ